jgi:ribosomal protein S18 acetylase RimI-like enzyme
MMTAPMSVAELEGVAHRTWPCRNEEALGQWRLREADGFTRRANSCLPIGDPGVALTEAIDRVEAWYRARELEPCVKIVPGTDALLDRLLAARGWSVATPSLVLCRELGQEWPTLPPEFSASASPDSGWLRTVSLWDGESPEKARRHRDLALRLPTAGFLSWAASDEVLAVGLLSMDGVNAHLYDVVVHPERRGRGIGKAFCRAAMRWARSCGTRILALQVLESNAVAQSLYAALGFAEHHRYHYRVAPCEKPTSGC